MMRHPETAPEMVNRILYQHRQFAEDAIRGGALGKGQAAETRFNERLDGLDDVVRALASRISDLESDQPDGTSND